MGRNGRTNVFEDKNLKTRFANTMNQAACKDLHTAIREYISSDGSVGLERCTLEYIAVTPSMRSRCDFYALTPEKLLRGRQAQSCLASK